MRRRSSSRHRVAQADRPRTRSGSSRERLLAGASERAGRLVGWTWAPALAALAAIRQSRLLHPEGIVLAGQTEPIALDASLQDLAERLRGPALVRFSTALWQGAREWPDVLGCAVRFGAVDAMTPEPSPGDQDLLFATVRSPLTLLLGPIGTRVHDFLANRYFAVSPFDVRGVGVVKWRLVPEAPADQGGNRRARLLAAVSRRHASLRLELRRAFQISWLPVARLTLTREVDVDQDLLRFWPFRDGRGIRPRGFVHGLRSGAYRASQMTGHAPRAIGRRT